MLKVSIAEAEISGGRVVVAMQDTKAHPSQAFFVVVRGDHESVWQAMARGDVAVAPAAPGRARRREQRPGLGVRERPDLALVLLLAAGFACAPPRGLRHLGGVAGD